MPNVVNFQTRRRQLYSRPECKMKGILLGLFGLAAWSVFLAPQFWNCVKLKTLSRFFFWTFGISNFSTPWLKHYSIYTLDFIRSKCWPNTFCNWPHGCCMDKFLPLYTINKEIEAFGKMLFFKDFIFFSKTTCYWKICGRERESVNDSYYRNCVEERPVSIWTID